MTTPTANNQVSLWLATKMGLPGASMGEYMDEFYGPQDGVVFIDGIGPGVFDPFTNPAQRMEVEDLAVMKGIAIEKGVACIVAYDIELQPHTSGHDGTPADLARATLYAVARATGYEGEV